MAANRETWLVPVLKVELVHQIRSRLDDLSAKIKDLDVKHPPGTLVDATYGTDTVEDMQMRSRHAAARASLQRWLDFVGLCTQASLKLTMEDVIYFFGDVDTLSVVKAEVALKRQAREEMLRDADEGVGE
jgi:hypothetical protein